MKTQFIMLTFMTIPVLAIAETPLVINPGTTQYVVRQIGTTTYIEPSPPVGLRGVAGAAVGTGIAAGLQSQPIRLKKGTDINCGTDLERYLPKGSCF